MAEVINGKVAAIIDDATLVLNIGLDQGVREGMTFLVFDEHAEIVDPDTGEPLGSWERVKARLVATHVQERMCTVKAPAEPDDTILSSMRPLSAVMVEHSMGRFGDRDESWKRMDVRSADVSGRPSLQPIAVGDRVRSNVLDEENPADPTSEKS
jgi:hypothetical protein